MIAIQSRISKDDQLKAFFTGLSGIADKDEQKKLIKEASKTIDLSPEELERRFKNYSSIKSVLVGQFLALEIPERKRIMTPWLFEQSTNLIYAPRGIGKTYLGLSIGVAVASGGYALKWQAEEPQGVLVLDGELPASVLQSRIAAIIASVDASVSETFRIITPDLQPYGMPDLSTKDGQEALEGHLDGIKLIIVDNLSTLCRTGRENDGESWLPVQEWALRMRTRGISVLFIHHSGKGGQQRGTSRKEDILDTVISLRRPNDYNADQGARFDVHFEKSRNNYGDSIKPFEAQLITGPDGLMSWITKDLEESNIEKVVRLLGEGVPQSEIADILGVTKGTVSKWKSKAHSMGLIV